MMTRTNSFTKPMAKEAQNGRNGPSRGCAFLRPTTHEGWTMPEIRSERPSVCVVYGYFIEEEIARAHGSSEQQSEEYHHYTNHSDYHAAHHNAHFDDHYNRSQLRDVLSRTADPYQVVRPNTLVGKESKVRTRRLPDGGVAIFDGRKNILYGNRAAARFFEAVGESNCRVLDVARTAGLRLSEARDFVRALSTLSLVTLRRSQVRSDASPVV